MQPDPDTLLRIQNLALVGTAIAEESSESTFQTNQFVAKEALKRFQDGIKQLTLPPEVSVGIDRLVEYLDKKLDRRMQNAAD